MNLFCETNNNPRQGSNRVWVAKITGLDEMFGLKREFLKGSQRFPDGFTTVTGIDFILEINCIYEVKNQGSDERIYYMIENYNDRAIKVRIPRKTIIGIFKLQSLGQQLEKEKRTKFGKYAFVFQNCPQPKKELIRRKVNHDYNNPL